MARTRETGMEYCGSGVTPTAGNAMTAAGAISTTNYYTTVDTTTGSGHASTLAKGSRKGQLKKILLIVDGGDLVVTATFLGGDTLTFADVGDFCLLQWDGVQWVPLELGNDADGATAPVLSTA